MKVQKRNRYYCDFCGKSGGHAGYMRIHEKHCTKNPDRKCRMCRHLGEKQKPVDDLLAVLPGPFEKFSKNNDESYPDYIDRYRNACAEGLRRLRDLTGNCPMCILTAVRLSGADEVDFDFWAEREDAFAKADGQ